MPLEHARIRQGMVHDILHNIGEVSLTGSTLEELTERVSAYLTSELAVLTQLSLNVRDIVMLLNRQNPDLLPVGPYPVPEPGAEVEPGSEVEPGAEVEPGTEPGEKNQ